MNPVDLYISTCRYVLQFNPNDQDTWVDLYRFLPYLRQALSCCVCTKVFHIPMGPELSKCQHHVCKQCLGGKMRLKPSCGWCNDFTAFIEKPELRTIVQCYKKLCEYLASSAIIVNLSGINNGGTGNSNQLLNIVQEGSSIRDDDYDCHVQSDSHPGASTSALNELPPKLHKVESGEQQQAHHTDVGNDQETQITHSQGAETSDVAPISPSKTSTIKKKHLRFRKQSKAVESDQNSLESKNIESPSVINGAEFPHASKDDTENKTSERVTNMSRKRTKKRRKGHRLKTSRKGHRFKSSEHRTKIENNNDIDVKSTELNLTSASSSPSKISETVQAEHDYNIKQYPPVVNTSSVVDINTTKSRARRSSGYAAGIQDWWQRNVSPNKKCKLQIDVCGSNSGKKSSRDAGVNYRKIMKTKHNSITIMSESKNNNNSSISVLKSKHNETVSSSGSNKISANKSSRHSNYGCRCGLATPKPGNLTCCGQRCPCYSAFKGCVGCRCRGCRNPRGDPNQNPYAALRLQRQIQNAQAIANTGHTYKDGLDIGGTSPHAILVPCGSGQCIEDDQLDIEIDI